MTTEEIISDIHALTKDLQVYERKYGMSSETFYALYTSDTEPADDAWILDWSDWAGAYKTLLRRREQYRDTHHAAS
jgi:accessory colonization factor AcfC